MRRGKLDLVRNNTSARYSSPTNTGVKNPLRLPLVTNKERGSLSSPPTAVSNKRRLRSKKPHSQSPSSQPVIKIFLILALVFVFALKPASASWANSSFD